MYTDETLNPIYDNDQYTAPDGTQYPRNFPKYLINSLHKVTESIQSVDSSHVIDGFTINDRYEQVWTIREKTNEEILADKKKAIISLEQSVTQRRIRDAILTESGKTWLSDVENQIEDIRKTL